MPNAALIISAERGIAGALNGIHHCAMAQPFALSDVDYTSFAAPSGKGKTVASSSAGLSAVDSVLELLVPLAGEIQEIRDVLAHLPLSQPGHVATWRRSLRPT